MAIHPGGRVGNLPQAGLIDVLRRCHHEQPDVLVPGQLGRLLDTTARVPRHVAVSDDHCVAQARLVGAHDLRRHIGDGAVNVGALAKVLDTLQVRLEGGRVGDGTEDLLGLGKVQATDLPGDLHQALVVLVLQLSREALRERAEAVHQAAWGRLLKGDGLRRVDDKVQVDGAFWLCWRTNTHTHTGKLK